MKQRHMRFWQVWFLTVFFLCNLCITANAKTFCAGDYLSSEERVIYDVLKQHASEIVSGKHDRTICEITFFENDEEALTEVPAGVAVSRHGQVIGFDAKSLGVSEIYKQGISGNRYVPNAVKAALQTKIDEMSRRILLALTMDCPLELAWFDKAGGITMNYRYLPGTLSSADQLILSDLTCLMEVNPDYCGADRYTVDSEKITTVKAAAQKANCIAAAASGMCDEDKLVFLADQVLELAVYNETPAESGNAYEAIWVFDHDPNTQVVCEGYAKAFQILFDLSGFTDARCMICKGKVLAVDTNGNSTGRIAHVWNQVQIDGKTYIVDLTNCDEGAIGAQGELFMRGQDGGSPMYGYGVMIPGEGTVKYFYDPEYLAFFGEDVLRVSEQPKVIDDEAGDKNEFGDREINKNESQADAAEQKETAAVGSKAHWIEQSLRMQIGQKVKAVMILGLDPADYVEYYTSSKPLVLKVSGKKNGKVTLSAKRKGSAVITAKLHSGGKLKMKVSVSKKAVRTRAISASVASAKMRVGECMQIKSVRTPITSSQAITYSVNKKSVVSVSKSGKITAKKPGTVVITVKSGMKENKIKVKVTRR